MKHLTAGVIVGIVVACVTVGALFVWSIINWLVGPVAATVIMAAIATITAGAAALDYVTEKRS